MIQFIMVSAMKTNKINTALRISAVILVMTMLLQFFGCSGGGETLSDPEEMYSFISENAAFPSMEDVDAEAVRDIYGIDLDKISRYVLRISEDKSIADEVAIFETADPEYLSTLDRLLSSRLNMAARAARDYSPEQYEIILKAEVVSRGRYVFFIVNSESASLTRSLLNRIPGE